MSGGIATAVELARAELPDEDEEQFLLFAEPLTEEGRQRAIVKRGPGRPPGARNKRTERTVAWLLARHKDPVDALLEIVDLHPADLAAMLGCSIFEAQQERRLCAQAAMPYVKQRQPLSVDVTNKQVVYLTISDGQVEQTPKGGDSLAVRVLDSVEYQEVSDHPPAAVGQSGVGQDEENAALQR